MLPEDAEDGERFTPVAQRHVERVVNAVRLEEVLVDQPGHVLRPPVHEAAHRVGVGDQVREPGRIGGARREVVAALREERVARFVEVLAVVRGGDAALVHANHREAERRHQPVQALGQ